jgi:hypothetical protein
MCVVVTERIVFVLDSSFAPIFFFSVTVYIYQHNANRFENLTEIH